MTTFLLRPSLIVVATALAGVTTAQRAQVLPRPIAEQQYLTLGGALDVETGDLDGDGFAEIVVSDTIFGSITWLSNRLNQTGRFRYGWVSMVEGDLHELELPDLDGDGDIDLATSAGNVLRNAGNGTFAAIVDYDVGASVRRDLTVADVDGDQRADLVVAVAGPNGIAILPNLGDGTFGAAHIRPLAFEPRRIASADFDRDGDIDLAPAEGGDIFDGRLSVLLNHGNF